MKEKIESRFPYLLCALFLFPLFKENVSSALFIVFSAATLAYGVSFRQYNAFSVRTVWLTLPFWIVLLACLFHYDGPKSLGPVNNALFFLLFPLVFSMAPKKAFSNIWLDRYFTILTVSCSVMAIGYIVAFLYQYGFSGFSIFTNGNAKFRDFVYYEIPFFKIHPTYYSTILVFCMAFSFEKVLARKQYGQMAYIALFLLISFLLLVKVNIIVMCTLLLVMLFRARFPLRVTIAAASALAVMALILAWSVPGITGRFSEIVRSYGTPPSGLSYDSTNIRVAIYACDWEIIKENVLSGIGFSNVKEALLGCFRSHYDSDFYLRDSYMTHNYFFYFLVSGGILALAGLLFYWYKLWEIGRVVNRFLLWVMLANVLVICCTEDYFYRHFGLFFFSLILMCFVRNAEAASNQVGS